MTGTEWIFTENQEIIWILLMHKDFSTLDK